MVNSSSHFLKVLISDDQQPFFLACTLRSVLHALSAWRNSSTLGSVDKEDGLGLLL